ncbi:MAG TPA: hypothetical protein VKU90_01835 [Caulobacteraceae bacterium]|nr:hypothetical protein [Caulobacteraceae bacterium]
MAVRVLAAELAAGLVMLAATFAAGAAGAPTPAQPAAPDAALEPGGAPADIAQAISDPDEYAWRLFTYVNTQAEPGAAGVAAPGRSIRDYEPDKPVVWETWALISGDGATQVGSEVLRPDGADPGPWASLPRSPEPPKVLSVRLAAPTQPKMMEVRVNEPAFETIRALGLYNIAGLRRVYAEAQSARQADFIRFPDQAKALKAVWKDLGTDPAPAVLARYHWRRIGGHVYGLSGLHIATRDLTTWFWADFEQVDDPLPPTEPSVDSTTRGPNASDRGGVDGERRELSGAKWAYYRLRGTQTGFFDQRGQPTRLANAVMEQGFEHSSCVTCHARATIRATAKGIVTLSANPAHGDDAQGRPPAIADRLNSDLGQPNPALFGKDGLTFLQTDFVWSMAVRVPREALKASPAK